MRLETKLYESGCEVVVVTVTEFAGFGLINKERKIYISLSYNGKIIIFLLDACNY